MKPTSEQVFTTKFIPMDIPNSGIKICFSGDIHKAVTSHCKSAFQACIDEWKHDIKEEKKGGPALVVLMTGDESDTASTSERKGLAAASLHGQTYEKLDKGTLAELRELRDELSFLGPRLKGMIQGNHHWVFGCDIPSSNIVKGMSSTQWLCDQLGSHWLGFLSYVRLYCRDPHGFFSPFDVVLCHGKAGAKLIGTSINQIMDLKIIFPNADVYVMAHDHQLGAWKVQALEIPNGASCFSGPREGRDLSLANAAHLRVAHREQVFTRSGSCLRGYEPGVSSYPVGGLFRPTALGMSRVAAKMVRTRKTVDGKMRSTLTWDMKATV